MEEDKLQKHYVLSEVTEEAAGEVIDWIHKNNVQDSEKSLKLKDHECLPLLLFINSSGGAIYDGHAIIAAIEGSKTPVWTICMGKAMSAGFSIFLAGERRFAHRFSTFLYHDGSQGFVGTFEQQKRDTEENKRLNKMIDKFIAKRTKITIKKLNEVKASVHDWYITAHQAKKLGVFSDWWGEEK